ncbi:MAG: thiamine pyrophosphate-binding protein [Balneolaceae bacterium]|nr:MAG: thiamine pyrophosphate-binding protein [Balneolaceae bacterium]
MKKTGAQLTVYALEQVGITHTFGIPGVHNTEIYDELNISKTITPVLVTHEGGGAFMADAISRTSSTIGCLMIVPAAGITHAMSGIGEAYLAGISMLVISGGIRTDTGRAYQLHDLDQHKLLSGITKKSWKVESHKEIIPVIYEAYKTAISGEPGPVFVEIPVNIQLFRDEIDEMPLFSYTRELPEPDDESVKKAAQFLTNAKRPGIFAGWGAAGATEKLIQIAELLEAPVATTLQGLSVFPGNHPLHTGMGIGEYAVPASERAFDGCDCLLAIGTRFGEIPTGSFGMKVPETLIHIDINPDVFNKNYPAVCTIHGDSGDVLTKLLEKMDRPATADERSGKIREIILAAKQEYREEWESASVDDKVNPALFFRELRTLLRDDAIVTVDDGNHTFLTAELFECRKSRHLISPTDFNCMGYCVPAAIGAKIANPDKQVVGIAGDGAFLMTGMELITAATQKAGVVIFVFNDGELSQISQGQQIPYNRKVCTSIGKVQLEAMAMATGSRYIRIKNNKELNAGITEALSLAGQNEPVVVDVNIDYSKKTRFTKGIVKTNLGRFPLSEKVRFITRALKRKITG